MTIRQPRMIISRRLRKNINLEPDRMEFQPAIAASRPPMTERKKSTCKAVSISRLSVKGILIPDEKMILDYSTSAE